MGCGTGTLGPKGKFKATLTFYPPIDRTLPVYTNFKSALWWLLQGLDTKPKDSDIKEIPEDSGPITNLELTVHGPLDDPINFNRAFNRLLWGVRHRLHDDRGDMSPGTNSGFRVTAVPVNWDGEHT